MAALNVAKILGFGVAVAVAVNLGLHYFGIATVGIIAAVAMLVWFIRFAYDIELSKLESKNALTKLKELK
jgi:Flp pilus assembly protein TadB